MEEFMDKGEPVNEEAESPTAPEPVVFKKDRKDGTVVAFFPETMHDGSCNPGNIMSYEHNGQHGEASIDYFRECRPCSEDEYADLLAELEGIYTDGLKVVKRIRYESVNDAADALDDPRWDTEGHQYEVELANGEERVIDPTKYEDWADVVEFGSEHYPNTVVVSDGGAQNAVGLVLSELDHVEIVRVKDVDTDETWEIDTDKTPLQWAKDKVWCYDDQFVD